MVATCNTNQQFFTEMDLDASYESWVDITFHMIHVQPIINFAGLSKHFFFIYIFFHPTIVYWVFRFCCIFVNLWKVSERGSCCKFESRSWMGGEGRQYVVGWAQILVQKPKETWRWVKKSHIILTLAIFFFCFQHQPPLLKDLSFCFMGLSLFDSLWGVFLCLSGLWLIFQAQYHFWSSVHLGASVLVTV